MEKLIVKNKLMDWKYAIFDILPDGLKSPALHTLIYIKRIFNRRIYLGEWKPITWEIVDIYSRIPSSDSTNHNTVSFWIDGIGEWTIPIDKAVILYRKSNCNGRAYLIDFILSADRDKFESAIKFKRK